MSGIHLLLTTLVVVVLVSAPGPVELGAEAESAVARDSWRVALTDGRVLVGTRLARVGPATPFLELQTAAGERHSFRLLQVRRVDRLGGVVLGRPPNRDATVEARARRHLAALRAPRGSRRQAAEKALADLGGTARPLLERARLSPHPEVRLRVARLLRRLDRLAGCSQYRPSRSR